MFISSLACRIRPEKEREFLACIEDLMERTRWQPGCFGCRLLADLCEGDGLTLVIEWADRKGVDHFLRSDEYHILLGMKILMEDEPRFTVDEVITRARIPSGEP